MSFAGTDKTNVTCVSFTQCRCELKIEFGVVSQDHQVKGFICACTNDIYELPPAGYGCAITGNNFISDLQSCSFCSTTRYHASDHRINIRPPAIQPDRSDYITLLVQQLFGQHQLARSLRTVSGIYRDINRTTATDDTIKQAHINRTPGRRCFTVYVNNFIFRLKTRHRRR